jgi:hypothetical protein
MFNYTTSQPENQRLSLEKYPCLIIRRVDEIVNTFDQKKRFFNKKPQSIII